MKDTLTAARALYHHFTVLKEDALPLPVWNDMFYTFVPLGLYKVLGSMTGPNGRSYIPAYILNAEEVRLIASNQGNKNYTEASGETAKDKVLNYAALNDYAHERQAGIAFLTEDDVSKPPKAVIRFGGIWSFTHYAQIGGNELLLNEYKQALHQNPSNPFDVIISDKSDTQIAQPTEKFLPSYIKRIITEEIKKEVSEARPDFFVKIDKKYAVSLELQININANANDQKMKKIGENLLWFLPPYLPLNIQRDS